MTNWFCSKVSQRTLGSRLLIILTKPLFLSSFPSQQNGDGMGWNIPKFTELLRFHLEEEMKYSEAVG
jgi:hypothetical protein